MFSVFGRWSTQQTNTILVPGNMIPASMLVLKTPYAHPKRSRPRRSITFGQHEHAFFEGPLLWNTFAPMSAISSFQWLCVAGMPVSDFIAPTQNLRVADALLGILLPKEVNDTICSIELIGRHQTLHDVAHMHMLDMKDRHAVANETCSTCSLGNSGKIFKDMAHVPIEGIEAFTTLYPNVDVEIWVKLSTHADHTPLYNIKGVMIHYLVVDNNERCNAIQRMDAIHRSTGSDTDGVGNFIKLLGSVSLGKKPECGSSCWMCNAKSHAVEYITHRRGCRTRGSLLLVNPCDESARDQVEKLQAHSDLCCDDLKKILENAKPES